MDPEKRASLRAVLEPPEITDPERQYGGPQSGLPPEFIVGQELASWLTVGIDFGTIDCRVSTFSNGVPHVTQPSKFCSLVESILNQAVNPNGITDQ